jgi:diguanylate cyclase (GGDEF)-like protein
MQKILSENSAQELKQTIDTRHFMLNAKLDREILMMNIYASASPVGAFLANPGDERLKKVSYAMLHEYKDFFYSKMLGWISANDMNYHVNEQFMEKYDSANAAHSWFFETLKYENPPLIRVDFDYLNRQIHDLYIDFPVYHKNEAVGAICSRISLFEFVHDLSLPGNVYVFGKDGVIIGASDEKIAKGKKTLKDLFGIEGEEVYKRALSLKENESGMFNFGNRRYLLNDVGKLDLFLIAKYEIGIKEIMQERASVVFFILLFVMLLVFIIFNRFIAYILRPINKNMQLYLESSLMDELTKIPNRRFFNLRMEDEWNRAVRGKYHLSFLMMDLDKFKSYNDTYGHAGGDALLKEAAKIFRDSASRTSDFAARIGGEEFCVVLPNTDADGARKIAEGIRGSVEKAGKATVSIGFASKVPSPEDNMQDFIKIADDKLYEAKESGRNRVVS